MTALFGNFDPATRSSMWKAVDAGAPSAIQLTWYSNSDGRAHLLLDEAVEEDGAPRDFVATATIPQDINGNGFSCHACAPLISLFVLKKDDTKWQVESESRYFGEIGSWGHAPQINMIQVGPKRWGFRVFNKDSMMGETSSYLEIAIPRGKDIPRALAYSMDSNNAGQCSAGSDDPRDPGLQCYAYVSTIDFLPESDGEYFDLQIATIRTKPNSSLNAVSAQATHRFVYSIGDGKYSEVPLPNR